MQMIAFVVNGLIDLYVLVLVVTAVGSLLVAFNVINRHNRFVDAVLQICHNLTEPALRPLRSVIPSVGGIDLSFIVLFFAVRAVQIGLNAYVFGPAIARGL